MGSPAWLIHLTNMSTREMARISNLDKTGAVAPKLGGPALRVNVVPVAGMSLYFVFLLPLLHNHGLTLPLEDGVELALSSARRQHARSTMAQRATPTFVQMALTRGMSLVPSWGVCRTGEAYIPATFEEWLR